MHRQLGARLLDLSQLVPGQGISVNMTIAKLGQIEIAALGSTPWEKPFLSQEKKG